MENTLAIPIEVSARHLHLTPEHVDVLFGKGYVLTNKKELSQKGYFVTEETVEVVGQKSSAKFSILIPLRKQTQVELAITDAIKLGITPYLRDSGTLEKSAPCILKGPKGEIHLNEGVIVARRHLHLSDDYANQLNVRNNDLISVKVSGERPLVFEDVLVRVDSTFTISMHIDTDEANAANINNTKPTYGKKIEEE